MIRKFKELLGIYETGVEYILPIENITIPYDFMLTAPNQKKFRNKEKVFLKYGKTSPIKLNDDFELVDGYITFNNYGCALIWDFKRRNKYEIFKEIKKEMNRIINGTQYDFRIMEVSNDK